MEKLSTENLHLIPNPDELKRICKSISALEAILCQEWEYRYYSYQKDWSDFEELCEMRNGEGDQMLIFFSEKGVCINGFAHESTMNGLRNNSTQKIVDGVVSDLPVVFNEFIFDEPIKSIGTTFCIWQTKDDNNWKIGQIDFPNNDYKDGSSDLLQLLDGNPKTYKSWAEDYYDELFDNRELKLELAQKIFNNMLITKELVLELNPELEDFEQLKIDLEEIGYNYNF